MTLVLPRRGVLQAAVALAAAPAAAAQAQAPSFSFLFLTDTHIEPELNATQGCQMAFARARSIGGDFAIQGGDHVYDALGVTRTRATDLMALYTRTEQDLAMPVRHVIGNHDCFGVYAKSGATPTDPLYGKKFFQDRFGQLFYSFDHKDVHFVILDSIGITPGRDYEGRVDPAQLDWLRRDLDATPRATPLLIVSHIPLATDYPTPTGVSRDRLAVVNASEVFALLQGRRVLGVLQGHTHVNETVTHDGIACMTRGAVCGDWWHGVHRDTPEGFTVVTVADGTMTARYETYGFQSVAPRRHR